MNRFRISTPEVPEICYFPRAVRCGRRKMLCATRWRSAATARSSPRRLSILMYLHRQTPELDQDQMLKIIDKSGRICVARPDNTTPIARIAATRLDDAALPVRLYYSQKVFRSVSGDHGHKGEFLQVGAEFIGADGLEADKDILTAAFAALSKTGADNFRVELGHAEIYKALMDELGADAQSAEASAA